MNYNKQPKCSVVVLTMEAPDDDIYGDFDFGNFENTQDNYNNDTRDVIPLTELDAIPTSHLIGYETVATKNTAPKATASAASRSISNRFAAPVSAEELKSKFLDSIPKKTRQANSWSRRVYEEWAVHKNDKYQQKNKKKDSHMVLLPRSESRATAY